MKSSLKVALGTGNDPVIKFNVVPSDDVRDQLCEQFFNAMGGGSGFCSVNFDANRAGSQLSYGLEISPVKKTGVISKIESINQIMGINAAICLSKNGADITMCYDAESVWWEKNTGKTIDASRKLSRVAMESLPIEVVAKEITIILSSIGGRGA